MGVYFRFQFAHAFYSWLLPRAHFHEFSAALSTIALLTQCEPSWDRKLQGVADGSERTSQPNPFPFTLHSILCQQGSCTIYLEMVALFSCYITAFFFNICCDFIKSHKLSVFSWETHAIYESRILGVAFIISIVCFFF